MATVNVLDFGADPNGVDDSTEAFCQALKAGDVVLAPAGRYRLNGAIVGTADAPAAPSVSVSDEVKVTTKAPDDVALDAAEE